MGGRGQDDKPAPLRERDLSPAWGAGALGSLALHALLAALLVPVMRDCAQGDAQRLSAASPSAPRAPQEVVEVVEEEPEAARSPEDSSPALAQAPQAPPDAPPEPKPPEPRPPEPTPPRPRPEPRKLMIDQPLVEQEEAPERATALGPQDRRVAVETQPRERTLKAAQQEQAPPDAATAPPAPQERPDPAPPAPPAEARPKGRAEAPKKEPDPQAQPEVKVEAARPEPAPPSPERAAARAGDPGDQGAAALPEGALPEAPDGEQGPAPGSPAQGAQAEPGLDATPGEAGEGARVDVKAALRVDPGRYEEIFGERDAQARAEIKNQPRRLLGRWEKRAEAMRASLENFVPNVRYGNQIAINTQRSVYASYIANVHRGIHAHWALGYLRHLDLNMPAGHPLSDPNLLTTIELVLDGKSGEVKQAIIVDASGNHDYDAEAVRVSHSLPAHGPAPAPIISPDGRVYLHWRFWRDTRQCGTFGVSVFVLDKTGKLDTWEVKEDLDDLEGGHAPGHRHKKPGPALP